MSNPVAVGNYILDPQKFLLIAGPCVIESEELTRSLARDLKILAQERNIDLIFKASFDKANRSSLKSYRGPGFESGLRILGRIRQEEKVAVLTDVHSPEQAEAAGKFVDVLQIPAFLSRQTDLLLAVAHTGKAVNIKKGQFMAPRDMGRVIEKVASINKNILVTERGYAFGYNNLVADMRSLAILRKFGYPVIFDATHSVQLPGQGDQSGGEREFVPVLARAAAGAGIDGIFIETHPEPERALSDSAVMVKFEELPGLLDAVLAVHRAVQGQAER